MFEDDAPLFLEPTEETEYVTAFVGSTPSPESRPGRGGDSDGGGSDECTIAMTSEEEEEEEEYNDEATDAHRRAPSRGSSPALPRELPPQGRPAAAATRIRHPIAGVETSLVAIPRQFDASHDVPAARRPRRGGSAVGTLEQEKAASTPALRGDLSDIEPPKRVGKPESDSLAMQDSITIGMKARRQPLDRVSSILNLPRDGQEDNYPTTAWPKRAPIEDGAIDAAKSKSANNNLRVIQQASQSSVRVFNELGYHGMSVLCGELDALLHDFLVHVCELADNDVFHNFLELQNGIHEVVTAMAKDVMNGETLHTAASIGDHFARPGKANESIAARVVMDMLKFLHHVPGRLLKSSVVALHTQQERFGFQTPKEASEYLGRPGEIYKYIVFHAATSESPQNLATAQMGEICRLITTTEHPITQNTRFRATIATVIMYSVLRVIDIAEEQKAVNPHSRAAVTDNYLNAIVATGIVKSLSHLISGQMCEYCNNAIDELNMARQKAGMADAASAASSSLTTPHAPIVNVRPGVVRPSSSTLSQAEMDQILMAKSQAELRLGYARQEPQPADQIGTDSVTVTAYLRGEEQDAVPEDKEPVGDGTGSEGKKGSSLCAMQ